MFTVPVLFDVALEEEEEPDFTAVEVLLVVLSNMS